MRSVDAYLLLAGAALALAQNDTTAEVVSDNPPEARYVANIDGDVVGSIRAGSDAFGVGVTFHVSLVDLPVEDGPFSYHLHAAAVPEDGDCMGTGTHLDPYGRTATPACDAEAPETCEVGDLSGKYGKVAGDGDISFHDLYTSLVPGSPAFFGDKSFVVHDSNGTRIACANFNKVGGAEEAPVEVPVEEGEDDECVEEEEEEETPVEGEAPVEEVDECVEEEEEEEEAPVEGEAPVEEVDECVEEEEAETPVEGEAPAEEDDECVEEEEEPAVEEPVVEEPAVEEPAVEEEEELEVDLEVEEPVEEEDSVVPE